MIKKTLKLHEGGSCKEREYRIIKEYKKYYLCECIFNGKPLYKECFFKIDVGGVAPEKQKRIGGSYDKFKA